MTREELKEHCKKQIEMCEMWAKAKGENPCGKVYEEHKMVLELLEQQPCEDAISRQAVLEQINCWIGSGEYRYTNATDYLTRRMQGMPPVTPQYTEAEIQKMQELEQAEIQKAYELGKAEQPCEDCIGRQVAINIVEDMHDLARADVLSDAVKRLKEAPPVTPQPKIGHWEWVQYDYNPKFGDLCCSECKSVVVECVPAECGVPLYKHCPQCGAKMQEVEK